MCPPSLVREPRRIGQRSSEEIPPVPSRVASSNQTQRRFPGRKVKPPSRLERGGSRPRGGGASIYKQRGEGGVEVSPLLLLWSLIFTHSYPVTSVGFFFLLSHRASCNCIQLPDCPGKVVIWFWWNIPRRAARGHVCVRIPSAFWMRAAPAWLLFCFRRRSSRLLSSAFFAVVWSETCGVPEGLGSNCCCWLASWRASKGCSSQP